MSNGSQLSAGRPLGGTKLVVAALVVGVLAVIANSVYLQNVRRQVARESIGVFVLERQLRPGDALTQQDVTEIAVPRDFQASFEALGAVNRSELAVRIHEGRQVQQPAVKGQLVTHGLFVGSAGAGLDRRIREGYRWKTIAVNSRTAPPILQPEMRIDMEAPFPAGAGKVSQVLPVMENVRVVAVGSYTAGEDGGRPARATGFQNIMIEVTPDEATLLSMVEQAATGPFELHLRNPGDDRPVKIPRGGINPTVTELVQGRLPARHIVSEPWPTNP